MADFMHFAEKLLSLEGEVAGHPADRGGLTNRGITLSTWQRVGYDKDGDGDLDPDDLLRITRYDALKVLRHFYWKRWRADDITSQPVAEILVDWLWCSGRWGVIIPQKILGVEPDGFVGRSTLMAVNGCDPEWLVSQVYQRRLAFIHRIIEKDPTQEVFRAGWLRRLENFKI